MRKRTKFSLIFLSLVYLIFGAVFLLRPALSLRVFCALVGGLILLCGVSFLLRYAKNGKGQIFYLFLLVAGVVCCALGLFLLFTPDVIVGALPLVFGLFIVFDSLVRFGEVLDLRRTDTPIWGMLALVLLSCALGVMMICNPFGAAELMTQAIGAILMVEGALNLCTLGYTQFQVRTYLKAHPEVLDGGTPRPTVEEGTPTAVDVDYHPVQEDEAAQPPEDTPAEQP